MSTTAVPSRRPWWLIVIFVVLTAALAGVGVKILRDQRQWLEDVARRATKSTTETRANDLLGWRQDRLAEAAALAPNRQLLSQSLAVLGPSPSDDAQLAWSQSLAIVLSHRDHLGAALFDSAGRFCRSAGNVSSTGRDRARAVVAVAQRTRNVELSDPYRDDEGSVHVQVAIPLEDQRAASATPPIAVVLEIDAQRGLMSVLRGRAMPSADSDILLVRQQSDGVVVLVAVHGAGALDVGTRIPANAGDAIAERVAKGEEGPFDGRTLNGAPAIGVTRKVGDTGWWLISLVSSEAAIAQTMMESWRLAAIVGLMVLATGSVLMLVWQRRQAALYRELYETEAGRQRLAESFGYVTRFANDIIVMADGDGKIIEANDRAVEAYGYTREEFIGLPLAALRAPEIKETVASDLYRLKTDGHFTYQAEHVRKDGTRFPVDLRARHFTEHGRTYFHGVIRDITERVAMERSLRDSAETYRTLFEQANDAIVAADAETGVILDANQKTAALTGRSVEELRGLDHTTLHPPDRESISRTNFRARAAESQFDTRRTELQHVSGRRVPVEVSASRIEIQGRHAVLGVFRDLTERYQREEELHASESRRQKLESLALLAGGIAHDFNNLLTGILGNISLARHGLLRDPESEACLADAERAGMRAKDLTQQLLTFSRGGAPIKKAVDVVALLRDTVSFACRGTATGLEIRPAAGPIHAEVDEGQIAQVINNIALNAVQAMPAGGKLAVTADVVSLSADNALELPAGRFARLTLADTGVGIPPELLSRVFDPYFTTKQQGSGLGLAISHSIVSRHGGHIGVSSRLGVGSQFEILLPACEEAAAEVAPERTATLTRPGRILVMDDEAQVRDLAVRMVTRLGLSGEGVAEGGEALRAYQEARDAGRPFDAVLMDLTISGGMGGKEAMKALIACDPEARGIVSSGYSNDPIMGNFRDYGFTAVLAKPYRLDEMRAVLSRVLGSAEF